MVDKRKSSIGNAGAGGPPKVAKKSPGGGGSPFGKGFPVKGKGGPPPQKQQQQKATPSPQKKTPPPPGAKKMEITTVKGEGKGKFQGGKGKKPNNQNQEKGKGPNNGALNKVAEQSKNINRGRTAKKNRYQRLYSKLDSKPRPVGACERALKAEQELGHSGRVFTVKVADPPLNHEVIKGWSTGIETAVFARPVEARQFFVVFKPNANVKKEVEALRKLSYAGGKLQVEEKVEGDTHLATHPEQIDPFSLYVTNLHDSVTKESLQKLFNNAAVVTPPRKHNPKIGSSTKFAFVAFESADDTLTAFKQHYNAVLSGNTIVMRFRRSSLKEMAALKAAAAAPAAAAKKPEAATPKAEPKVKAELKKGKQPVKTEPDSEEDEEDDDDDDDEQEDAELVPGLEQDEDDDDDDDDEEDDDDDLDEDEDDDDDDDDDDDE
jgi:hypothetical protein